MNTPTTRLEALGLRSADGPLGPTWHPASDEELRGALKEGATSATPMAPLGTGSSVHGCRIAQASGNAPVTWLSTRSLIPAGASGIVEYVPGDGTITAHAGTPWSELKDAVKAGGHRLTPAIHGEATLGGVIAAGRSGLDRCAFGPARHHVLGLRVMDGTGRVARSGGRLVKNVTGFDLHRVHTGAAGTLGVILEASLRLMPIPESEILVESEAAESPAAAVEAALRVRSHPGIQPRCLFTVGASIFVGLAGRRGQVETEQCRVKELVAAKNEMNGPEAAEQSLRLGGPAPAIRILCRPSNCVDIVRRLDAAMDLTEAMRVEPDAAVIDLPPAAALGLSEDFWGSPARAIREAGGVFGVRIPVGPGARDFLDSAPMPHAPWTDRLERSFDPGHVLRIPR